MNELRDDTVDLSRYRRIHIGVEPMSISSAARFIVSSLLVSHGVREDAAVIARLRGGDWLLALGNQLRHLRPDEDTAVGWIKAVIRGKKELGGILLRDSVMGIDDLIEADAVACVYIGEEMRPYIIPEIPPLDRYIFIYTIKHASKDALDFLNGLTCKMEFMLGIAMHAYSLAPSIINILIDRIIPGLRASPC